MLTIEQFLHLSNLDFAADLKQEFAIKAPLIAACLFSLFIIACTYGAQPAQSESGISENIKADTVHIPNSTREKEIEPVRIKNSKSKGIEDTTILLNSDEPAMEREPAHRQNFMSRTPVLVSSPERVKSKGKIIAGAALFGASYVVSFLVGTIMSTDGSSADSRMGSYYYIPVLGPAIVGTKNYSASDLPTTMLFFGWSIAEGMGLTLLITGLVGTPAKAHASAPPLSIEPLVMKDRTGLIMRMRF